MVITLSRDEFEQAICDFLARKDICPGDGPTPLIFIFNVNEGHGHMTTADVESVSVVVE